MLKEMQIWRKVVVVGVVLLAVLAVGQVSMAAPLWRGEEGSTYQKWTFDSDANPASPSTVSNPYGVPSASITVGPFGEGWQYFLPGFGTTTGYWDMGSAGTISIPLQNRPYIGGFKEMWIQVNYFEGMTTIPTIGVLAQGQVQLISQDTFEIEADPTGGAWNGYLTKWRIEPNPINELVVITADADWGSLIDAVEIDTICVPEPASFAALLMGVPFLVAVRRRRA